jgi:hypothetical protein
MDKIQTREWDSGKPASDGKNSKAPAPIPVTGGLSPADGEEQSSPAAASPASPDSKWPRGRGGPGGRARGRGRGGNRGARPHTNVNTNSAGDEPSSEARSEDAPAPPAEQTPTDADILQDSGTEKAA